MPDLKLSLALPLVALPLPHGEHVTRLTPTRAAAQRAGAPDDEFYSRQWGLPAIDAPGAWALTTGSVRSGAPLVHRKTVTLNGGSK